jgi:FkbM family methyltransferase
MTLTLPHTGAAATAYYRTFPSAAIAAWLEQELEAGMTAVDVGAHAGVYTLVMAHLVGPTGIVHAIEPQVELTHVVTANAAANGLGQVRVHACALGRADEQRVVHVDARSGGGVVRAAGVGETANIGALTLGTFTDRAGIETIDLLKLDAAGDELAVLDGAGPLVEQGTLRRIVCKLYAAPVTAERFDVGHGPGAIVDWLDARGYDVRLPGDVPASRAALERAFADDRYTVAVLARRP